MNNINLSGFVNRYDFWSLWKAYQEGVYADTPSNRKLGRVGMTYLEFERLTKTKKEETEKELKVLSEKKRKLEVNPPKFMSESDRRSKFSNLKKDDVIYLEDTYKTHEGNFTIKDIKTQSPTSKLVFISVVNDKGEEAQFLKDFLLGEGEFKDFPILDINYSLQDKPTDFFTNEEALDNFDKEIKSIAVEKWGIGKNERVSNDFLKEDIKIAFGSVSNFKDKTKNIELDPWGVSFEVNQEGKNQIYTIEAFDNKKYKITHFSKEHENITSNIVGENISPKELKDIVYNIYNTSK